MKLKICLFLLIAAFLSQSLFAQAGAFPAADEWFSFAIEQNGLQVPVKNSRVEIEKAPFTLLIITRGPLGVLVNCSVSDALYKGFLKNKPIAQIIAQPDLFMGIGEATMNPDEMILVDKFAPHYLFYTDAASHRYSKTEMKGEYVVGRRVISNYTTYALDFSPVPIEQLESDTLFFSMMHSEYDEDYNVIELQKEALKVIFRD